MSTPTTTRSGERGPAGRRASASARPRRSLWLLDVYQSALGKKYAMALTGIVLMLYVLAHMIGNLKLYLGASPLNHYSEWLRDVGAPVLPHTGLLWLVRLALLGSFAVHIHAAYSLTRMNRRARPDPYRSGRDYVAADFAGRTMRWTGVIVGLFVIFHLLDLTWGYANPDFVHGDVYHNVVASFQRWPVALFYVLANVALGYHLYHGGWSLFQSMGWNNPRFKHWRRYFSVAFAALIVVGNISFPVAVVTGLVG